jgi:hypothetical protein
MQVDRRAHLELQAGALMYVDAAGVAQKKGWTVIPSSL